jgi:MFS family permease
MSVLLATVAVVAVLLAAAARELPAPDRPVERDVDAPLLENWPKLSPAMRLIYLILDGPAEKAVTVIALATAAASTATLLMALLERAHQDVDHTTSVKALTLLDVVASTSMQVGLLIGGLLVSASVHRSDWPLDPYRIWLVVGTAAVALSLATPALRRPRTG